MRAVESGHKRQSKPAIHRLLRQHVFHVVHHARRLAQGADAGSAERGELAVAYCDQDGVVGAGRETARPSRNDGFLVINSATPSPSTLPPYGCIGSVRRAVIGL